MFTLPQSFFSLGLPQQATPIGDQGARPPEEILLEQIALVHPGLLDHGSFCPAGKGYPPLVPDSQVCADGRGQYQNS